MSRQRLLPRRLTARGRIGCRSILPVRLLRIRTLALLMALLTGLGSPDVSGDEPLLSREHYVPANQLDVIFERTPQGVMLPQAEFEALLQQAHQARQLQQALPTAVVIRSAQYSVQQLDNQAVVELTLDIQQFAEDWQTLEIPVAHLDLEAATIDGQPASVGRASATADTITLLHRGAGRFILKLTLSTALGSVGSDRISVFGVLANAAASLQIASQPGQSVEVNDLRLDRPEPLNEATRYEVPVGAAAEVRIRWTERQQQTRETALVFARSDARIQLSVDTLRWNSDTRVTVYGSPVNQLIARVPSSLEITGVDSLGLESWTLEDDPERAGFTRVTLSYRQPFTDDRVIQISGVAAVQQDQLATIPVLEFVNLAAHTGRLVVTHARQLRLQAVTGVGIRQLSGAELPGDFTQASVFDFWLQDYELSVAVQPRDRELFSQIQATLFFQDTLADLQADLTIETLNEPLFEVNVTLPEGWQIRQIDSPDKRALDWRLSGVEADTSQPQIIIEPSQPIGVGELLTVSIQLRRAIADPATARTLPLPVVSAADATLVSGIWQINSAPDLKVTPVDVQGLVPIPGQDDLLQFETQGTTYQGQLRIERRPARISVRSELRTWAEAQQVITEATVTADVTNGTTRTLQLLLPETVGENQRFEVVSIGPVPGLEQQQVPSTIAISEQSIGPARDGQRLCQLTFDRRFAGSLTLQTRITAKREAGGPIPVPFVRVPDAVRQHGLLVLEAAPDQKLTVDEATLSGLTATHAGLVAAPPTESGRRVALVFRYVRPDYSMTVSEVRYDTQTVPTAVCERIDNLSLLSDTGTVQRSATVYLRCVGVQTLRFSLPEIGENFLWSTMLNGEAIEVRRDGPDYLVAIPTGYGQTEHVLEILFETSGDLVSEFGRTLQESIALSIRTDPGEAQPIEILEQTWDLRYPAGLLLLDHDGSFYPLHDMDQAGWLRRLGAALRMPPGEKLWESLVPLAVILMILFIVTVLAVRRRWWILKGLAAIVLLLMISLWALPGDSIDLMPMSRQRSYVQMSDSEAVDEARVSREADQYAVRMRESETFERRSGIESEIANGQAMPGMGGPVGPDGDLGGYGGMSSGGVGGGGMGFGGAFTQPATGGGEGAIPQMFDEQLGLGMAVPQIAVPESPAAASSPLAQQSSSFAVTPARSGSARLSVQVDLQTPADYRSAPFRTVGTTNGVGQLDVVIQSRHRLLAIRLLTALIVLLACWWLNPRGWVSRLSLVAGIAIVTLASVPLLPNQWQPVADGAVLGTVLAVISWVLLAICRGTELLKQGRFPRWSRRSTAVAIAACLVAATATVAAADEGPTVVKPYPDSDSALTADRVYLSQPEFLKLYRLAHPEQLRAESDQSQPRVVAAVYRGEGREQVRGQLWSQTFQARFVIHTFADQPVNVTLPLGSVAIRAAVLDGSDAILIPVDGTSSAAATAPDEQLRQARQQQQQAQVAAQQPEAAVTAAYAVRVTEPGLHVLDVTFEVAATVDQLVGKIQIPLLPVPAGTLTLGLPDADEADELMVTVNRRSNNFRRTDNTVVVPIAQGGPLSIQWQPRTSQTSVDATYHAAVNSALTIDDAGLSLRTTVQIDVRQGQISELSLSLPAGYSVQQVTGSELAGWNLQDADPDQGLQLLFRQPVTGSTAVSLQLFSRQVFSTQRTSVSVPVPAVTGASRDYGNVSVLAGPELQVRTEALSGVSQINPAEASLPEGSQPGTTPVLAWRYTRHPVSIAVRVSRQADQLEVRSLHGVQLESQRQLWTSHFRALISGSPRHRLDVQVPRSFLALEVSASDLADWYVTEADDDEAEFKTLTIQFTQARTGSVDVVIQGQTDREADRFQPRLTPPRIPQATSAETHLSVWLDAASEIAGFTAAEWNSVGTGQVDSRILQLQSDPPEISFVSPAVAPQTIALNLRAAAASLLAESVSVTNVTDTSLELTLGLNWQISRAATNSLSLELPGSLADAYDFTVPNLRQLQQTELENNRVRITFHLQQPVSESFFVLGTGTLPLPGDRQIVAEPPTFVTSGQDDTTNSIASQSHFWVLVNQSSGVLAAVNPAADGDAVSADQLRTQIPQGFLQQSVAIRRLNAERPQSPWQLRFPQPQQVAPAVVALAAHVTVLAADGSWRSGHQLEVRNESRQFLPVVIPDGSRFLYCLVRGQPARIVQAQDSEIPGLHLIPVPQSGAVTTPFTVEFALAGQLPGMAMSLDEAWRARGLQVPVPEFPEYRDSPEFGVTVIRNTWSVYVPQAWHSTVADDPRRTNVIPADAGDFQDARVSLSAENVKALLEFSDETESLTESWRRDQELQEQQQRLLLQRGEDAQVEQARTEALQQLQEHFSKQQAGQQQAGAEFGRAQPAFGNSFLYEQDARQNYFNRQNNADFIYDNAPGGLSKQPQQQGGRMMDNSVFRFQLPDDQPVGEPANAAARTTLGRAGQGPAADDKAAGEGRSLQRSQLLEQKDTRLSDRLRRQPTDTEEAELPTPATMQKKSEAAAAEDPFAVVDEDLAALPQEDVAVFDAGVTEVQDSRPPAATGLLSLTLSVPVAGERYDFVRPGGNPELTLEVRGREAVETGLGGLWAVGCLLVLLIVLAPLLAGRSQDVVRRLLWLAVLAGLAGWVFLPSPLNGVSLLVCLGAAVAISIITLWRSFYKPSAVEK